MWQAKAVSIDVVNMPESSNTRVFEFLVRALDQFGNVDELFEREVTLDGEGMPPDTSHRSQTSQQSTPTPTCAPPLDHPFASSPLAPGSDAL